VTSTPEGSPPTSAVLARRAPPIVRHLFVAVNLAVVLLLIALAWGRFPDFYRDPVRNLAVAIALLPTLALLGTSGAGKGVKHAAERGYILISNGLWNLTLLAMVFLRGHQLAVLPGDGPLRLAGLTVLGVGALLRAAAMLELGRRFSLHVALQREHTLRTTGLYTYIRHPSYLGLLLLILGLAMVFESQLGILATVIATVRIRGRMDREEKFLLEQFGDEYRDYMARTKRLVPGIY